MIRRGDWKLIFDMQGNGQLYHLSEDPVELNNLYNRPQYATIQQELLAELRAQGFPIDEGHAALGMVFTQEQEKEEDD